MCSLLQLWIRAKADIFYCYVSPDIVSTFSQLLLSTSYFWRNYLNHYFDFDDEDDERLTGMLHELGSSWLFGWGHGVVQGLSQGDLFEELPRRWKSGVIHPVGPDVRNKVQDYKALYEALYQLQKLQDEVNEREIVYGECSLLSLLWRRKPR